MLDTEKMFARIVPIAQSSQDWCGKSLRGGSKGRRATNIKENIRYMRIKRLHRSSERKRTIAPAAWQEFIEI